MIPMAQSTRRQGTPRMSPVAAGLGVLGLGALAWSAARRVQAVRRDRRIR
jgi:hypothetical protein